MVAARRTSKPKEVTAQLAALGIRALRLRLPPDWVLTNEGLLELCGLNETVPFEIDETGALTLSKPGDHTSGWVSMTFVAALHRWMDEDAGDLVYGSGGLFELPDGNRRVPDAAWVSGERSAARIDCGSAPDLASHVASELSWGGDRTSREPTGTGNVLVYPVTDA